MADCRLFCKLRGKAVSRKGNNYCVFSLFAILCSNKQSKFIKGKMELDLTVFLTKLDCFIIINLINNNDFLYGHNLSNKIIM